MQSYQVTNKKHRFRERDTCFACKTKTGLRILVVFQQRPLKESSRRYLFNDMAEHGSILKNNQNTYARFSFTPNTGIALPKTGILSVNLP